MFCIHGDNRYGNKNYKKYNCNYTDYLLNFIHINHPPNQNWKYIKGLYTLLVIYIMHIKNSVNTSISCIMRTHMLF